ncbi:MAG: hypothetical protein QOJ77_669 [Microbacteriaceae bacterium]|jgi:oligopeptide/dipeptide ABC transporter ATP-binding protein|nr:hypothetical protein [Microbacteriaceae bacterium]
MTDLKEERLADIASPVLTVDRVVKHFPVRTKKLRAERLLVHAVDDVSMTLDRGKTLGVVGESGCGKSTLGRLITGLVGPTSGSVLVSRPGATSLSADEHGPLVQMVFQDPASALDPRMSIGATIAETIPHIPKKDRDRMVRDMLVTVGLPPEFAERRPHELSGGQQQRVCIARALICRPALVLLDEAVSALDASLQAQVLTLLRDLQASYGASYVFISHDLRAVREISDRIIVMYLGQVVESAPAAEFDRGLLHPYSVALRSAEPRLASDSTEIGERIILKGEPPSAVNPPSGCRFAPRCPIARPRCVEEAPTLQDAGDDHLVSCHFAGELSTLRS